MHRDLRRYVSVAFFLSAAVGAFGVLFLILGLTRGEAGHLEWPFVIFGGVAIASGILGMTLVPRHYRTATRVVAKVTPVRQQILLELESDSDSTSLYATILEVDTTPKKRSHRYGLVVPVWNVESVLGEPLEVSAYVNPATHRPVAFGTAKGMLWCLPSWQGQA